MEVNKDKDLHPKTMELIAAQQLVAEQFVDEYKRLTKDAPDDADYTKLRRYVAHLIAEVSLTVIQNTPRT